MALDVKESKVVEEIGLLEGELLQRKRAEEALRESEERYRSIVENSPAGIVILDDAYRLIYVNDKLRRISGYSREEIIGQDFRRFLDDESKELVADRYLRRQRGEKVPLRYELNIVRKDGEKRCVEISSTVIKDSTGKAKTIAQILDITERKRAEEALGESHESYKELADSIADIFFAVDKELRYTYWNKASEDLTGISAKDAIGKSLYDLFPDTPQTRRAEKVYLDVLRTQQPQTFVNEYQLGGKDFIFEISAYPSRDGLSVFVKDVTERKRAEEEIRRRSEELAALNAIGMTLTSTLDLQEVLRAIQERVMKLLGEKYPPLFALFNEGDETFEMMLTHVREQPLRGAEKFLGIRFKELSFPISALKPALRECLLAEKPYVTDDGSDLLGPTVSRRLMKGAQKIMGIKQIVDVPLWAKGKLVGAMVLFSQKEKIPDEEMELLSAIASQAAIAIDNARLYEERRRKAEELAVLNEIGRAVSSVMQLDDLLELICQEASRVIDTSSLYIALYDVQKKEISFSLCFEEGERRRPEKRPARRGITEYVINSAKPLMINHDLVSRLKELDIELIGRPSKSWLGVPILSEDRVIGVLAIQDYQKENAYDESHLRLLSTIASQAAIAIENARAYQRLEEQNLQTITALAAAVEAKDPYTSGHCEKVTQFVVAIAKKMGLSDDEIEDLRVAALLHDIGKIGIPDSILNKPARLTLAERIMVDSHPVIAAKIVGKIEALSHLVPLIRNYHERWDGNGYPGGLKGEEIPLGARILAVADDFEAMTSDRPYRKAWTEEEALAELEKGAGSQWDPQVVEAFVKAYKEGALKERARSQQGTHIGHLTTEMKKLG